MLHKLYEQSVLKIQKIQSVFKKDGKMTTTKLKKTWKKSEKGNFIFYLDTLKICIPVIFDIAGVR